MSTLFILLLSIPLFATSLGSFIPVVQICPNQCISSRNAKHQAVRQCHTRSIQGLCKIQKCHDENGLMGYECALPHNSFVVKNEDLNKAWLTIYFEWNPYYGYMASAVNMKGTSYGDYCAADNEVVLHTTHDMSNDGGDWFELDLEAGIQRKFIKKYTRVSLVAGWKAAKVKKQGAVQIFLTDEERPRINPDGNLHLLFDPGNYQPISECPNHEVGRILMIRSSQYTRITLH